MKDESSVETNAIGHGGEDHGSTVCLREPPGALNRNCFVSKPVFDNRLLLAGLIDSGCNSDLIGKYINLASRNAGFIHKLFDGKLADHQHDVELYNHFILAGDTIAELYEQRQFSRCMREIMQLADKANQYIDHHKPWSLAKDPEQHATVQAICTQGLNLFRVLTAYLKPVLPQIAADVESFLNCTALDWTNFQTPLLDHEINRFKPLLQRITIEAMQQFMGVEA